MIETASLVNGLICGCVLIIFGSVRGLLQSLVDGMQRFSRDLQGQRGMPQADVQVGEQPFALVFVGFGVILLVSIAYMLPPPA